MALEIAVLQRGIRESGFFDQTQGRADRPADAAGSVPPLGALVDGDEVTLLSDGATLAMLPVLGREVEEYVVRRSRWRIREAVAAGMTVSPALAAQAREDGRVIAEIEARGRRAHRRIERRLESSTHRAPRITRQPTVARIGRARARRRRARGHRLARSPASDGDGPPPKAGEGAWALQVGGAP